MAARPASQNDGTLALALSVVASSYTPLLLLDGDLGVIAVSASFCTAFQIDPRAAVGRLLVELGAGEWNAPQLRALLAATASGDAAVPAYELDLKRKGMPTRCLVLNAQKLAYGDEDNVRLLVAVADVTDARAAEKLKDDLLREKAILLQEIQHRIANSLQIIASVLMQSARRVNSEETRGHLEDAHSRVMSVAALQHQLSMSSLGEVALRSYLTKLCDSIAASMIRDPDQLSLEVAVDDSVVSADVSVSLGLITTELVINALKHAFPDNRKGAIRVDYRSDHANWTLSVQDDGIGMTAGAEPFKPGLGTSIVESLARQLRARIQLSATDPGTLVAIVHTQLAAVQEDQPVEPAA